MLAFSLSSAAPVWADGATVKLGVLTDFSGVYSSSTGEGSVVATRMAVEDCLAAECAGMTIDVVAADHQNKPDVALSVARRWVDAEGVDALVDMSNAAIQLAIAPFVAEKGRIALFAGGTARLTGDACQPGNIVQWMWDTYVQVAGIARPLTKSGTSWYLVTADYAFGHQFEADAKAIVTAQGGKVLGSARHPFPSSDFSSYLLTAQSSGADIVALANAGDDTVNAIKQAREFGLGQAGGRQKLVAFYLTLLDVHAIGLPAAAGAVLTEGFYWDLDDGTRAFARRFMQRRGMMPSQIQAGLYSAVRHYLKSAAAARAGATGKPDAALVMAKMHALPVQDDVVRNARLREDGRLVHDYYVFQVKRPEESRGEWDLYTRLQTIPGDEAFRPLDQGGCPRLPR